jgi:hypothetical protein
MASQPSEPAQKKHGNLIPWQPGQSGNPAGRQKGSRNRLGEDFIDRLHSHWVENGDVAIERVFEEDPATYLKVIARVIPSEVIHTAGNYDNLSDSELDALILETARRIVADAGGKGQKALPAPLQD